MSKRIYGGKAFYVARLTGTVRRSSSLHTGSRLEGKRKLSAGKPLVIGEVLFDEFPNRPSVLGGAPFNVAWNLQGLGLTPLFVSAVGADDEGREVRARMEAWEMDVSALQVNETWPTGKVRVELNGDEPCYHILEQQAYDEIRFPDDDTLGDDFSLLYLGSLAYRSSVSRSTINRLICEANLPRFVDINVRQPWFHRAAAADLLDHATWVKLSIDELSFLANTQCGTASQIAEAVATLRNAHSARHFFITCGAAGAYSIAEDGEVLFADAPQPIPFVDAVGAGDAFSAPSLLESTAASHPTAC